MTQYNDDPNLTDELEGFDPQDDSLSSPLAEAVEQVLADRPDPQLLAAAADRAWQRIESAAAATAPAAAEVAEIAGCDDYQALIPAYLAGELSPERTLLLEDHSRECLPCRRALTAARTGKASAAAEPAQTATSPARRRTRWLAIAAMLVAVIGLGSALALFSGAFAGGEVAVVQSVDGPLLHVGDGGEVTPLAAGDVIDAREMIRAAHGGGAVVRLADGSEVELAGGTELSVRPQFASTTIRLARGNIIVEAAKRERGHLYVATDECRVAVTGTIFSVNHGVRGSRVSVIEGEVRVARASVSESVLHPGMQVTTRASLDAIPVAEEVAWSRNNERYVDLLRELTALTRALDDEVERPGLRSSSNLIVRVPEGAVGYLAFPNLSEQLMQSWDIFRRELATSPMLSAWWQENGAEAEPHIDRVVQTVSDFGGYLGEEVVVAVIAEADGEITDSGPIFLAEIVRPGFRAFLDAEVERLNTETGHEALVVVDDPYSAPAVDGLLLWPGLEVFAAAPTPELLALAADAATGQVATLASGELYDRVQTAYDGGVEWLFAADLRKLTGEAMEVPQGEAELLGVHRAGVLVVQHESGAGELRSQTSAEISFPEGREGVVSWVGEPGAIGALDFVSADAAAAAALLVREPAEIFDELLSVTSENALLQLAEAQAATGVDFRQDLAASLGSEMAIALDGPVLPEPAWKFILEVHDPIRLQSAIERLVQQAVATGEAPELTLETSELSGRPAYRLADSSVAGDGFEVHYVYSDGYMVAAPSRALLQRCLDQHAAGASLTASAAFRELLPRGADTNASGIFYQNLGPTISPLMTGLSELNLEQVDPQATRAMAQLAEESEPTLGLLYADSDRVRVAATSDSGVLGLGYRTLLGLGGLSELAETADWD